MARKSIFNSKLRRHHLRIFLKTAIIIFTAKVQQIKNINLSQRVYLIVKMLLFLRCNFVNQIMTMLLIINARLMEILIAILLYGQFLMIHKSSKLLDGINKKLFLLLKIKEEPHFLMIRQLTQLLRIIVTLAYLLAIICFKLIYQQIISVYNKS